MILIIMFLIAHFFLCAVITVEKCRGRVPGSGYMIPIMWLIPVVGIALYYLDEYVQKHVPDAKRGYKDVQKESAEVDSIDIDAEHDSDMIIPIEEALVEGNDQLRRKLMFKLLDAKGTDSIHLLHRLASAEDKEIAHFASTSLMEYRKNHEQRISDMAKKLDENKLDRVTLEEYCDLIKEYLESGILPPAIRGTYLEELRSRYEELVKINPRDMDRRETYLTLLMESGDKENKAGAVVDEALSKFPGDMRSYQMAAQYSYMLGNRTGIDKALEMVTDKQIYLNKAGRNWYSFWKGEAR